VSETLLLHVGQLGRVELVPRRLLDGGHDRAPTPTLCLADAKRAVVDTSVVLGKHDGTEGAHECSEVAREGARRERPKEAVPPLGRTVGVRCDDELVVGHERAASAPARQPAHDLVDHLVGRRERAHTLDRRRE
jgi:hypothetical protein